MECISLVRIPNVLMQFIMSFYTYLLSSSSLSNTIFTIFIVSYAFVGNKFDQASIATRSKKGQNRRKKHRATRLQGTADGRRHSARQPSQGLATACRRLAMASHQHPNKLEVAPYLHVFTTSFCFLFKASFRGTFRRISV